MSRAKKRSSKSSRKGGSLLSPTAMGGLAALAGFDFQTRYAACHLPIWLQEGTFHQLFFEGAGDIDVRFVESGKSSRHHIQVKNHDVSPTELKEVFEAFQQSDSSLPNVYKRFTLACPSLSATLRPIESGLARLRGAKPFYDDVPAALAATQQQVDDLLRKRGLRHLTDFIHEKVFIDVGHGELCRDDRALDLFIGRLLSHPAYADKVRAVVQPAFSELMRGIIANKGTAWERTAIEKILEAAVATGQVAEKGITIWIQNWTRENFDPPPDFALDWSDRFDRSSRRVPAAEAWSTDLFSELQALQKKILAERKERLIRLRGKCALSTGIMLGATFPTVGGWRFEIPQPPARAEWRSDVPPSSPYDPRVELVDGSPNGTDLVLGLNIRADGRSDVIRYVEGTNNPPKIFAFFSPPSQGAQSIGGDADACAFAAAVRDQFGRLLKAHQLKKTRMFFYGPFALAVFLGQRLTSVGEIQLFEFQESGYVPSCSFRT